MLTSCGLIELNPNLEELPFVPHAQDIVDFYQLEIEIHKDLEQTYVLRPGMGVFLLEYAYNNETVPSELSLEYSYLIEVHQVTSEAVNVFEENIDLLEETFGSDTTNSRLINGLNIPANAYYGREYFSADGLSLGSYLVVRIDHAVFTFRINYTEEELPRFFDHFILPYLEKAIEAKELKRPE